MRERERETVLISLFCLSEDDTGQEMTIDRPTTNIGLPLNVSFFDSLLRTHFPALKNAKCYEMVTLYVGAVPFDVVAAANAALAASVKRNNM